MPPTPARRGDLALRVLLPLLGFAWLLGTAGLLYGSAITAAPFFGEQPSATESARAAHLLWTAVGWAVVVALLGVLLAVRLRSRVAVATFAVLLLIGVVLAVGVAVEGRRSAPPQPAPASAHCQEHSGGGTRCPGG